MYDIRRLQKRKEVDGMTYENKDKETKDEVTETPEEETTDEETNKDENQTEEVEETDKDEETNEQQDDNEESEAEDNQDEEETEEADEGGGLTEEERTYFNNQIIELDRQLFEIKEQEKQKEVERKMKDRKYTPQQIERYSGMIDKNDMDKSITQLSKDIPPRNHQYTDPSLNNGSRQKINNPGKAGQLRQLGTAMAKYMKGRKGRRN